MPYLLLLRSRYVWQVLSEPFFAVDVSSRAGSRTKTADSVFGQVSWPRPVSMPSAFGADLKPSPSTEYRNPSGSSSAIIKATELRYRDQASCRPFRVGKKLPEVRGLSTRGRLKRVSRFFERSLDRSRCAWLRYLLTSGNKKSAATFAQRKLIYVQRYEISRCSAHKAGYGGYNLRRKAGGLCGQREHR